MREFKNPEGAFYQISASSKSLGGLSEILEDI